MPYAYGIEKLQLADLGATSVPHLALAHPTPLEAGSFGQLGALLVLEGPETVRHEVALSVTETLKERYYHSEELNPEAAFESALSEVNKKLHQLLSDGVNGWLPRFSAAVFAARGDQLILALVGSVVAQLFRGPRIVDLASTPGAERAVNPLKVFASVVVGHVEPGDAVLLATPSLLDYYSLERLKRLTVDEAPGETLATLERQLIPELKRQSFGAFLLTVQDQVAAIPAPAPEIGSSVTHPQTSMEHLIAQEERTASFLTPSFIAAIGRGVVRGLAGLWEGFRRMVLRRRPRRKLPGSADTEPPPPSIAAIRRTRSTGGSGFLTLLRTAAGVIVSTVGSAVRALRRLIGAVRRVEPPDPVMVRDHLANLPKRTERRANRWLKRILAWPTSQKVIAGFALVLLVVFAQSVVSLGRERTAKLSRDEQQSIVQQARVKVDAATAALSYGDERTAAQDLADAATALERLPKKPKVAASDLSTLRADLAAGLDRTQHRVRVDDPVIVADVGSTATENPRFLQVLGDTLLVGEVGSGRYALVDRPSGSVTTKDPSTPDVGAGRFVVPEGTTGAAVYTDRNQLLRYTLAKGGSFAQVELTLPEGVDVRGMAAFQSRLYLLDAPNNRVLRLTRAGAEYSSGTNWLTDATADVTTGISIAVDGSVFVLRTDGTVDELFQGKPTTFTRTAVSPALTGPTKLWTDEAAKNLYLLDPASHRLVVYSKQGALVEQLILPDSLPLADFAVNEKGKEALILSGTKILRVELAI